MGQTSMDASDGKGREERERWGGGPTTGIKCVTTHFYVRMVDFVSEKTFPKVNLLNNLKQIYPMFELDSTTKSDPIQFFPSKRPPPPSAINGHNYLELRPSSSPPLKDFLFVQQKRENLN